MQIFVNQLQNEEGSVIVMALLILAALTIIGISSTSTSTVELKIVRNEQIYQTNFYQAEAAAYEAAQRIEQETDTYQLIAADTTLDWLNDADDFNFFNADEWVNDDSGGDNSDTSLSSNTSIYSAVSKGVRRGSSLNLGATRLYEYGVYGKSEWNTGSSIVEIGYLRRF